MRAISALTSSSISHAGRTVLAAMIISMASLACSQSPSPQAAKQTPSAEDQALAYKFRGIYGIVTRIDAATVLNGTLTVNESGWPLSAASILSPKNVANSAYGNYGFPVPKTIRATWREGDFKRVWNDREPYSGGTIIGDYTVPVAERIPDEVLDYIRKNGGALRLKIRLHDEGVFIGWDVEMRLPIPNLPRDYIGAKNYLEYRLAGGDFQEATFNSDTRQMNPGWYIDKTGNKVMTNY